ncbi:MAG: hypothetical protein ACI8YQ_003166 [Polaribacter sp.]|jgi:hypothetical protein
MFTNENIKKNNRANIDIRSVIFYQSMLENSAEDFP